MTRKLLYVTVVAALAIVAVVAFAIPASAEQRTFRVKLSDGSIITVTVDAACGPVRLPGAVVGVVSDPCANATTATIARATTSVT